MGVQIGFGAEKVVVVMSLIPSWLDKVMHKLKYSLVTSLILSHTHKNTCANARNCTQTQTDDSLLKGFHTLQLYKHIVKYSEEKHVHSQKCFQFKEQVKVMTFPK